LGAWRTDDEVGRALALVIQKDRSYLAAGNAAAALGRTRARNAATELKKALQRDSQREVIRISALTGLAALQDERQLPLILEMARPGLHQRVRSAALSRAADLARNLPPEQRRPVREAAEEMLRDPLYFARRGAIDALRRLGDASAIGALEAVIERDLEGAVRHETRVAIESLRSGATREEALKNLRDELDALRRSGDDLRSRLEKLEPAPKPSRQGVKVTPSTARAGARTAAVASRPAARGAKPAAAQSAPKAPAPAKKTK
jgi:aminopeptidase N